MVAFDSPTLMFSGSKAGRTERNALATECFAINVVDGAMIQKTFACIQWKGEERIRQAGFHLVPSSTIRAHVAHLKRLEEAGRLELCGPFCDKKSGIVILRGVSQEDARAIAEADPFVSSGAETYEIRKLEVAGRARREALGEDEGWYEFTEGRSQEYPLAFLSAYTGRVQADAFSGYDKLFASASLSGSFANRLIHINLLTEWAASKSAKKVKRPGRP